MAHSALIHVITKAIDKARGPLVRDFGEVDRLQVSKKGTANFVSSADLRTESILIEELSRARKGWGILSEEAGERDMKGCEFRFVIDPIDGTTNFIHAIPYFCVSVAAQKRIGENEFETIGGVIVDPIHDEIFVVEAGVGATVNHRKLQVAGSRDHLMTSTATPRVGRPSFEAAQASVNKVAASGATVRCTGSAALDLAYVAAGRFDAIWYHQLRIWDRAVGELLVLEAGGKINRFGAPFADEETLGVIASSASSEGPMLRMLNAA